jgi:tetratricopeptide (TPR) repeat protein
MRKKGCPFGLSCADMMQTPALAAEDCPNHVTCNTQAWNSRSRWLEVWEICKEELASYDQVLALQPDNAEVLYNRAIVLDILGRYEEAIASYNKALEFLPDYSQVWYKRGITLGKWQGITSTHMRMALRKAERLVV